MMGSLTFIRHNAHRVDVDDHAMLMHVPTTSLFFFASRTHTQLSLS